MTLLRKPGLHFVLIGTLLFLLQGYLFPEPKPSVGPLQDTQLESLRRQWFATTARMPNDAQLAAMVRAELDREILFREALALNLYRIDPIVQQRMVRNMRFLKMDQGRDDATLFREALRMELHLGDEVVKRRLIQLMEQILLAQQPPVPVTETDLVAEFEVQSENLVAPARYSLQQVFLSRERGDEAEALLEKFREENIGPEEALEFSSPFLPGYRFASQSGSQLARQFGAAFVDNMKALDPHVGAWTGPVQSTYGVHLLWLDAMEAERPQTLAEVSDRLRRELEHQRRQAALDAAIAVVRERYEVLL